MNNIKLRNPKGGMGPEIDLLAANGRKRVWVEVSVSTNAYRRPKKIRFKTDIDRYAGDFERKDKAAKVSEIFRGKKYEKWAVYGKLALTKVEKDKFVNEIYRHGHIRAIFFGDVLRDLMGAEVL
jgi:hypothetical protein